MLMGIVRGVRGVGQQCGVWVNSDVEVNSVRVGGSWVVQNSMQVGDRLAVRQPAKP